MITPFQKEKNRYLIAIFRVKSILLAKKMFNLFKLNHHRIIVIISLFNIIKKEMGAILIQREVEPKYCKKIIWNKLIVLHRKYYSKMYSV